MKNYRFPLFFCLLALLHLPAHADYNYEYYEGDWSVLPNFDALTPVTTGTVPTFDISVRLRDSQYGFRFTGTVTAAGHATVMTGRHPSEHGVIDNSWVDRATGELVYSATDRGSPRPDMLRVDTFGDRLIEASGGASRVFAVAGCRDR